MLLSSCQDACSTTSSCAGVCPGWHIADILYSWMAESQSNHGEGVGSRCCHWCSNLEAFGDQHIQRHLFWKGLPIWERVYIALRRQDCK